MTNPLELPIRDAGTGVNDGALPPLPFETGSNGAHVPLHNSITKTDWKRIYCIYSRTQNSVWFSILSVIIFEVNIAADHVNAKRMTILVLFYTELKQTIFNPWYSTSEPWGSQGRTSICPPWKSELRIKIL